MSRVAAAAQIPIGSDEGIHRPGDIARHHERKAAGGVSLKAIKLGGLRGLVEASRLCERFSMHVNISCKTGETSLAPAAAIHAAAVAPEIAWGLNVTSAGLAEDVAAVPLRIDRGYVEVPQQAGLGIEIDERRIRHCQEQFKRVA